MTDNYVLTIKKEMEGDKLLVRMTTTNLCPYGLFKKQMINNEIIVINKIYLF